MSKTLQKLKESALPRLDWRDVLTVSDGSALDAADEKALSEYFAHFVKSDVCIKCGAKQGARDAMEAFMGSAKFTYGIQHGEGFCGECKYPARAIHYDVGPIKRLEVILQYHPDELSERKAKGGAL